MIVKLKALMPLSLDLDDLVAALVEGNSQEALIQLVKRMDEVVGCWEFTEALGEWVTEELKGMYQQGEEEP